MPHVTRDEASSSALSGKGVLRLAFLFCIAAAVAALAGAFGIARDYGYLHASILSGTPGGEYHAVATRLSERARREHGTLTVIPTAGSIENVTRLTADRTRCAEMFALIQDGTPVPRDARFELLGKLPQPESCCFWQNRDGITAPSRTFGDLPSESDRSVPVPRI